MINLFTPDLVRAEFDAISRQERRSWGQVSTFLNTFELTGLWKNEAKSFTEWLARNALALHYSESTLWRYLTVGRYYNKLRPKLLVRNVDAPALEELTAKISPENFEILSKLERIVPNDTFIDLADRLMQGKVTRAMLRSTWETFRPVLNGKTARGRGVDTPRFDPHNAVQHLSMFESMVIDTISKGNASWLGGSESDQYGVFVHVGPLPDDTFFKSINIDLVIMTSHQPCKKICFTGIEISGMFSKTVMQKLEAQSKYCDMTWLALPDYIDDCKEIIPSHIGILTVLESTIHVIRHASTTPQVDGKTGDLAKALLMRIHKR